MFFDSGVSHGVLLYLGGSGVASLLSVVHSYGVSSTLSVVHSYVLFASYDHRNLLCNF